MSRIQENKTEPQRKPWFTSSAIWAAIAAWASLGISGWLASTQGVLASVLIALTLACDVLAARLPVHAGKAACRWRAVVCVVLALWCAAFTGFAAKRGIDWAQTQGRAPFEALATERAGLHAQRLRIEAELAALPALRSDIPAVRLQALAEARRGELERLRGDLAGVQGQIAALPRMAEPPPPLPKGLLWALVGLVECLKLLALWAIDRPAERRQPGQVIELNPGRALAQRRWSKSS